MGPGSGQGRPDVSIAIATGHRLTWQQDPIEALGTLGVQPMGLTIFVAYAHETIGGAHRILVRLARAVIGAARARRVSAISDIKFACTDRLDIAYFDHGPPNGPTAVLLHGFPYDAHAYDEVAAALADRGVRSIVPYLRGYGPTRFRNAATPRSGEQAALGADLVALLDTLSIEHPVLAGFDWGGRAACVVAALDPARVAGLVTSNGYNIQPVGEVVYEPASPINEHRKWYQYYLHGERGRRGLEQNRKDFCQLLWQTWSPSWAFSSHTYARTAASFDNPDFVDVVVHSYRVRYGLTDPDPAYADDAQRLSELPAITVPTIVLDPSADGVEPLGSASDPLAKFSGPAHYRLLQNIGHNAPQEAPDAFAAAVHDLIRESPGQ